MNEEIQTAESNVSEEQGTEAASVETESRIPAEGSGENAFALPDDYKDRGWAKKVKSQEDVYKLVDNLDKLAGKKLDIPDFDNATDEQRKQFFDRLRPVKADDYALPDGVNEAVAPEIKKMLHDTGLSPYQAKKLVEQYMKFEQGVQAQKYSKEGFVEQMKASFGDQYEPVVKEATATLRAHLNDADKAQLENLSNDQLSIMYRFAKNMADAYGAKETGAQVGGGETKAGAVDVSARRAELLQKIQGLSSKPHSAQEKSLLLKEYNALTTQVTAGKAGK